MSDFDPIYQELAQRASVPSVGAEGTILVKTSSPGRQYEVRTLDSLGISGGSSSVIETQKFTLTDIQASNMYVELDYTPDDIGNLDIQIRHAPLQEYSVDYKQNSMFPKRIEWVGLGLEGMLSIGDTITIFYTRST